MDIEKQNIKEINIDDTNIEAAKISDLDSIVELVERVSNSNILPHFSEEGRLFFTSKVLPDIKTTFDDTRFQRFKLTEHNQLIGFGAMRDHDYITHLFIDDDYQGTGLGKRLLHHLLKQSPSGEVRLRASVNAVNFYQAQGFEATAPESEVNGIRFVPMRWTRS